MIGRYENILDSEREEVKTHEDLIKGGQLSNIVAVIFERDLFIVFVDIIEIFLREEIAKKQLFNLQKESEIVEVHLNFVFQQIAH